MFVLLLETDITFAKAVMWDFKSYILERDVSFTYFTTTPYALHGNFAAGILMETALPSGSEYASFSTIMWEIRAVLIDSKKWKEIDNKMR